MAADRPNILVIMADQMRGDTMGCAGHPMVETPNLDYLAKSGVIFRNAYTPDPVCVPARATLTTGCYPHKCTGIKNNGGAIFEDQAKIAQFFSDNGYISYAGGKLHYVPYSAPGEPRLLHGFDFASLAESGRILSVYDPQGRKRGVEDYHDYLKRAGWGGYSRAHGIGNNDIHPAPSPLPEEHYVDAWVCSSALDYLDNHLRDHSDKPFFSFVSFPKPHAPYDPPRPYDAMYSPREVPVPLRQTDRYSRTPAKYEEMKTHGWDLFSAETYLNARAHYYGQVTFQDKQVGRLLDYLREKDMLENTIVIYTADHGDMLGDFGFFAKSCFYRGSVNIPLIVSWPGHVRENCSSDALVGLQDVLPTLSSLAGLDLGRETDGMDLSPLLRGDGFTEREYIISYYGDDPRQAYMIAGKKYKYIYSQINGVEELYDLENDPEELRNIAFEARYAGTVADMKEGIIGWAKENGDLSMLDGAGLKKAGDDSLATCFQPGVMGWRWY
ncbi:MAG: sulfatase-like hydrolase/transferase [bacterium]|nr:sulfatase-like hydrolase/transferase [bacterium]